MDALRPVRSDLLRVTKSVRTDRDRLRSWTGDGTLGCRGLSARCPPSRNKRRFSQGSRASRYTGALERVLRWEVSGLEGVNREIERSQESPGMTQTQTEVSLERRPVIVSYSRVGDLGDSEIQEIAFC